MSKQDKQPQQKDNQEVTTPAKAAARKENRHAIILTGGIDSTTLLYEMKKKVPEDVTIVPIITGDKKYVSGHLEKLKIKNPSLQSQEQFPVNPAEATDEDWDKFFEKFQEENDNTVNVIYFAANYEEGLTEPDKNMTFFQRLNSIASKYNIQVSAPYATNTKQSIIQRAIDDYDIDLEKLAPPKKKDDAIRKQAFSNIYSMRTARRLDDPFAVEPRKATVAEGG